MARRLEGSEPGEAARLRRALRFVVAGLVVEALCLWNLRPLTFLALALVAVPLVAIGMAIFVRTVWRVLRETGSL